MANVREVWKNEVHRSGGLPSHMTCTKFAVVFIASRGQVIERILAVPGCASLFVVSAEADRVFHQRRIRLSSDLPFVKICPSTAPPGDCDRQRQREPLSGISIKIFGLS